MFMLTRPHGLAWFAGVPISYFAFVFIFRAVNWLPQPTEKGSRMSDMMAFLIVAGGCVTYLSIFGVISRFSLFEVDVIDKLADNINYGRSEYVENYLIFPMIAYQGWNTLICLVNKDLNDWKMILHHIAACSVACSALHPYIQYDAIFYFGICELTSVPLTVMDVFKYLPNLRQKFGFLDTLSQGIFVIFFYFIRVIYWPYYNMSFYSRGFQLIQSAECHSKPIVGGIMVINFFLTLLQFYWGKEIACQIVDLVRGTPSPPASQDVNVKSNKKSE